MKPSLILTTLFSLLFTASYGQNVSFPELPDEFRLKYEFSSVDVVADTFFFVSEKCRTVLEVTRTDQQEFNLVNRVSLSHVVGKNQEIEGVRFYHNFMFYTDETRNEIRAINLHTDQQVEIRQEGKIPGSGSEGLEGLAINDKHGILYAMKERVKGESKAKIYCFKISTTDHVCKLAFLKTITIHLPVGSRCPELTFNQDYSKLYILRTSYNPQTKLGAYMIDEVNIEATTGLPSADSYTAITINKLDISQEVNAKSKEGYHSNLEGMVFWRNQLWLVSDNWQGTQDCGEKGKKTLLVSIPITNL